MEKVDKIISARWVAPFLDEKTTLENHSVVIHQGKIKDLLSTDQALQQYQSDHHHQMNEHILLPGFINTHTHNAMTLLRGIADDRKLMDWLNNYIWPTEKKFMSDQFVFDGSLLAIAELIKCGVTCFNDMYFFPEATARAVEQSGIRANLGINLIEFPTPYANNIDEYFSKGLQAYEQYHQHERINFCLAPHAIYTISDPTFVRVLELAEQHDMPIHIHVQETAEEVEQSIQERGKRPLKHLYDLGLVSPRMLAVHMTQIVDEDIAILKDTGAHIVHCPESNLKLASGYCPVQTLLDAGVNVALGTDGAASNNDLNMIGEMRSAAFMGKYVNQNPEALPAHKVVEMATLNGAKALNQADAIGSLAIGKQADCVAIDLNRIETQPVYDPIAQVVYAGSRDQVTDVWVAGKQLLAAGNLTTIDEQQLLANAKQWQAKIGA